MKRVINPWIAAAALAMGAVVAWLGWLVTDLSCRADQSAGGPGCPGWSAAVAIVSFIGGVIAMAIVLAMTTRSIAEYREARDNARADT